MEVETRVYQVDEEFWRSFRVVTTSKRGTDDSDGVIGKSDEDTACALRRFFNEVGEVSHVGVLLSKGEYVQVNKINNTVTIHTRRSCLEVIERVMNPTCGSKRTFYIKRWIIHDPAK